MDGGAKAKNHSCVRFREFLKIHKDAYKAALDGRGSSERASRAVVQALDQVYYSATFYLKPCFIRGA